MELLRNDSSVARYVADLLVHAGFTIIDVGCSGGLHSGWRAFGEGLRAVGLDPSVGEVARLNALEQNPKVAFYAGFVGLMADHPLHQHGEQLNTFRRGVWHTLSTYSGQEYAAGRNPVVSGPATDVRAWEALDETLQDGLDARLSAYVPSKGNGLQAASGGADVDDENEVLLLRDNRWHEMELADPAKTILLPTLLEDLGLDNIDFIKIDVDGLDYEVLWSTAELLGSSGVMGAMLEVNFIGSDAPYHHTFHNTDKFMRAHGFDLYGLTVRPYTSAALPAPYIAGYPGPNTSGRPLEGDALYLRNTGIQSKRYDPNASSVDKLAKLIALFSLFGLPDQAAEVVLRFRGRLEKQLNTEHLLNLLALEMQAGRERPRSYKDYMQEFAGGHGWFFGRGEGE